MGYQIIFSKEAKNDIQKLDITVKKRLKKKLEHIASSNDIKSLAKRLLHIDDADYRIRIGDYRMTFDLEGKIIAVIRIRHRKDVYR
jgi:mRNA interferase RelE/StbE